MRLWCRAPLIGLALLLALAAPVRAQSFGFPWWRDAQFQKELGLSGDQSKRIDDIFQSTIPILRHKKEDLDQQEAELSRLIAANADEQVVIRQVDKIEAVRSNMNKMRTLLLLHMRQVLSPDQRTKLNRLYEERVKDRNKPRGDR